MKISRVGTTTVAIPVYLINTNVISEARKGDQANAGVRRFFRQAIAETSPLFLSVITVGELRRGVESIRHRGDGRQAGRLERWLNDVLEQHRSHILDLTVDIAQLWGLLRVPHPENPLDKLIAATALIHDLSLVTRNHKDFSATGARVLNPFSDS